MTITSALGTCQHCGDPITVTSRNPNRRFCSTPCRKADWRTRHRATAPRATVPRDGVPRDGVPSDGDAVGHPKALTRCPHCHQQVTVLLWMLPPAAAHVTPPRHG